MVFAMADTTTLETNAAPEAQPTTNNIKPMPTKDRSKERAFEQALDDMGQLREDGGYAEAGPFYACKAPVANAIGGELGIVTKDAKTGEVARTGIGFYVRSDHMFGNTYQTMPTI